MWNTEEQPQIIQNQGTDKRKVRENQSKHGSERSQILVRGKKPALFIVWTECVCDKGSDVYMSVRQIMHFQKLAL